ncbi:putative Dehydration-responsive element-binding protein 1F [Tripterygium wilfordii]|uniref:Putative Dehydration-responsive element-binding protein 1F n=1 Tax=Tripterygium wilfordii TaxID=458696 RepID=A0A7J7CK70_TRIWF|nr:dehydration-responsive element-binding protein 1E-like [Tripterygium wilfordii]KAF5734465.1 putative Dehydration-responsive element-binding protein 1F [Tripterygium wilfordii]
MRCENPSAYSRAIHGSLRVQYSTCLYVCVYISSRKQRLVITETPAKLKNMNIIQHFSDPCPFTSNEKAESSSSSASDCASSSHRTSHSNEEFLLATNRPKKRAGRRVFKETRHPTFRGVRRRNNKKWVCELREPNKKSRLWLGTYPSPEMAARAHDVAALALRGKSACLNFADSAWRLPVPATMDGNDIKRAATEAAEMFRPQEIEEIDASDDENADVVEKVSSDVISREEKSEENGMYIDEEDILDMPRLLVDMAQGLLISPPRNLGDGSMEWDEEGDVGVSLWTFSV